MIQFVATGAALAAATGWVERLTPARPLTPALAGVLLTAKPAAEPGRPGTLTLSVYDFETAATTTIDAEVTAPGTLLVSARLLAAVARTVPREPRVMITYDGGSGTSGAEVSIGKGQGWELPTLDQALYPGLPASGTEIGSVDADAFGAALARVLPAASQPHEAPQFGGIALSATDGTLTIAATDRHRLAVAELPWLSGPAGDPAPGSGADFDELLTAADMLRVATVAAHATGDVLTLHSDGNGVSLQGARYRLSGRIIANDKPGMWRQVERTVATINARAVIDLGELRQAVARASVVLDKDEPLTVNFDGDGVTVRPAIGGRGRAEHGAPVHTYDGAAQTAGVSTSYLADALDALLSPMVTVAFSGKPWAPFLLLPTAADGTPMPGYRHVLAQLRMPDAGRAAA